MRLALIRIKGGDVSRIWLIEHETVNSFVAFKLRTESSPMINETRFLKLSYENETLLDAHQCRRTPSRYF